MSHRESIGRTRVLHIVQNLNYGGMERLIADICRGADPSLVESHVLVLQYLGRFADGLDEMAMLHEAPAQSRLSLLRPHTLSRTIRAIAPDVVHMHSGVWYKASRAARMAGVPRVIHTEHGRQSPDPVLARVLDRLGAQRTDVVVAVSESVAELLRTNIRVPASKIRVILNGVDTERFRPLADTGRVRAELGIAPGAPIIGSVGRLEPLKGYEVMIRAFAMLKRRGALNVRLIIAGDGSERLALEALCGRLDIRDDVHLVGWRNDLTELLSCFSVFTMSSRTEGTSVSLLEAMSSGVCPVVTDVGGNRAVLGPELAHRLVRSEDPAALAEAWRAALTNDAPRQADGAVARERVISTHSARAMIDSYQNLYAHPAAQRALSRARAVAATAAS